MTITGLDEAFQEHYDIVTSEGGAAEYCLSVNAVPGMTLDEIGAHSKRPNGRLRPSTAAAIRAAGFEIEETPGRRDYDGHCDVYLAAGKSHKPNLADLVRLQSAFAAPIVNPKPYRGGGQQ